VAASKKGISNFWVPSLTPSTGQSELATTERKLTTICPASDPEHTHPLSLKSLVEVNFSEDPQDKTSDGQPLRICPSCKKALNNNVKSYRIFPLSHMILTGVSGTRMWTCYMCYLHCISARGRSLFCM